MFKMDAENIDGHNITIAINQLADTCPFCHYAVKPISTKPFTDNESTYIGFFCPRNECNKYFIYEYYSNSDDGYYFINKAINGYPKLKSFSETIQDISSVFVEIYKQAEQAEALSLKDICGVGYRKALEFLIKDYIILNNPSLAANVKKETLTTCITKYITNQQIISISKRAVWLGNDETHYTRKWEGLDINHLKQLIDLTVHWIETEDLTKKLIMDMPEPKGNKPT